MPSTALDPSSTGPASPLFGICGLELVEKAPDRLILQNNHVRVAFLWDRTRSFELRVTIRALSPEAGAPTPELDLSLLLRARGADKADQLFGVQACDQESLDRLCDRMARALVTHGKDVLGGDRAAFAELAAFRQQEALAADEGAKLQHAREDAQAAWEAGDLQGVIDSLEPWAAELSPSETKRIDIARRRTSSPDGRG